MKISSLKFANILIAAVLLVSPFVVGLTASQYDPWADINDDGKIDIKDIAYTAKLFGTLGDPTKNVTVTNWPVDSANTVWYWEPLNPGDGLLSDFYNTLGFGHLHILVYGVYLAGSEEITVLVQGVIQHPTVPSGKTLVDVYSIILTESPRNIAEISIPVPSAEFRFGVQAGLSTTGSISLGFYLTWA